MTGGEGWNIDGPVNQDLILFSQPFVTTADWKTPTLLQTLKKLHILSFHLSIIVKQDVKILLESFYLKQAWTHKQLPFFLFVFHKMTMRIF